MHICLQWMGKILLALVVNVFICCVSFAQGSNKISFSEIGPLSLDSSTAWVERVFNTSLNDDVQIVALGEVSHGGYEPLALKAKMIQYLVEKRGYRNILMEFPDIEDIWPVRQYLLNNSVKELSIADSLAQTTTTGLLNAQEVFSQLFRWLKLYNLAHPQEMVKVVGCDLSRDEGFRPFFLYNYIIPFDPVNAQRLLYHWENNQVSDSLRMDAINTWFNVNKSRLMKEMTKDEFSELQYHLQDETNAIGHKPLENSPLPENDPLSTKYRDSIMAHNVIYFTGSQKTIVWAHNGHVSTLNWRMGKYLKAYYKSRYFILLTDFSNEANIYAIVGENEVAGGNRAIREQHFTTARTSISYNLLKNYGISSGIFFAPDIPINKVYNDINVIDLHGKQFIQSSDQPFDVLAIFSKINPSSKPANNR
ncbi:erythromycin esterase family protein [Chitinophaga sp. 22321]|uniref:Erythromycin esterase family protein n=1 Tax=Chitinophaga hostae TaxID=2831022 RepID=A0ABS5J0Q7_9BACT|nr:erythromycin esterase family protein [Chitinophaga hostae]MBS0028142.1 erythromycin esterase family protein [Chitinophaga hostae]